MRQGKALSRCVACLRLCAVAHIIAGEQQERREVQIGIGTSLVFHVLLFLLLGWWLGADAAILAAMKASRDAVKRAQEEPKVAMLLHAEQFVTDAPKLRPKLSNKRFIDNTSAAPATDVPTNAEFQAAKSSRAASQMAPSVDGRDALPTSRGVDAPTMMLSNRSGSTGDKPGSSAPTLQPREPSEMPDLAPKPAAKPVADFIKDLERSTDSASTTQLPFEIQRALPATSKVEMRPPEEGYQPASVTAKTKGRTERIGQDSVDATATPVGTYMDQIDGAVKRQWMLLAKEQAGKPLAGSVKVEFFVNREGKPEQITFQDKEGSKPGIDNLCDRLLEAILRAQIPAIPREVLPSLEGQRLKVTYNTL
jgi:hypothetical protein